MRENLRAFAEPLEAQFRASRRAALAQINGSTFWLVAALVMAFSWWDWYVDPAHWQAAFVIRCAGALVVLGSGAAQIASGRSEWASLISKVRYTAAVTAVAGALAVLERGYVVGIAGLIAVMLSGPYIAIDRRDLLAMNGAPLAIVAAIVWAAGLERFAVVNSAVFIALAMVVSLMLARVFEASNRRAFALERQLSHEARTDPLTGLRNRRALEELATAEVKRAARSGSALAVILCDIDHFKAINDVHGHDVGDGVIRAVGDVLGGVARESDTLGRWGGDEFLTLLPETDAAAAAVVAERMRAVVQSAAMHVPGSESVTLSLGVAAVPALNDPDPGQWERAVRAADRALYRAKAAGRNRVVVDGDEHAAPSRVEARALQD